MSTDKAHIPSGKTTGKIIAALTFLFILLLPFAGRHLPLPAGDSAQQNNEPQLILRYADNQPEGYPTTQAAYSFAEEVSQRTNGRVQVRVYSNGELGSEQGVVEQMEYGGVDFSRISIMILSEFVPQFEVLELPYLYESNEHMWKVLDGDIGQEFLNSISSDIGLTGLAWYDAGVRHFYTTEEVTCLEDLSGLQIRVGESSLMQNVIRSFGAVPVPLTYDDVYSALAKNEIDGAENNWPSYYYTGHYEVAKYVLEDAHTRIPEVLLASSEAMESLAALDETYPDIIRDCAKNAQTLERQLWQEAEEESLHKIQEAGITITALDDQEQTRFKKAALAVYEDYSDQEELIRQIRDSKP